MGGPALRTKPLKILKGDSNSNPIIAMNPRPGHRSRRAVVARRSLGVDICYFLYTYIHARLSKVGVNPP